MSVLINIDVPDLARAIAFYSQAFGLTVKRRFGADGGQFGVQYEYATESP